MIDGALRETILSTYREQWGIELPHDLDGLLHGRCATIKFNGGVCICYKQWLDIFVEPSARGKWPIRGVCNQAIRQILDAHPDVYTEIHEHNVACLRLAKRFGFREIGSRDGKFGRIITLRIEGDTWVEV